MAKQSGKNDSDEIDFTDSKQLSKLIDKSTSKKKSKQNLYDKIISYVTTNVKKVAIIAIYIVISGIIGNIVFIVNNPLSSLIVIGSLILIHFVLKIKIKKV